MRLKRKKTGIIYGLIISLFVGMIPACQSSSVLAASTKKKPTLTVQYDEISLKSEKMHKSDEKNYTYSAVIKNNSKTGTIKKIQYYYQVQIQKKVTRKETIEVTESPEPSKSPEITETPLPSYVPANPEVPENPSASGEPAITESPVATGTPATTEAPITTGTPAVMDIPAASDAPGTTDAPATTNAPAATDAPVATPAVTQKTVTVTEWVPKTKNVVLTAKKIKPGKSSVRVSCAGDSSGKTSGMKLVKVKLYAGDALYTYVTKTKKSTLTWGTKDKKAPVFSGWIGDASIYSDVTVRVCYADRKNSYTFKDHVKAVDDRDGNVSFSVDTSQINWEKDGIYKIYYTAKDKAGNEAESWAKVQVYKKGTAESIADEVLRSIIQESWSDEKKARAIYSYVKGHTSYTDEGSHTDWRARAVDGIRFQRGDCFTFYSMARLLLTRAGIPNLEVTRYPGGAGYHHWWNLVYIKGGWYHLDTTPRRRDGKFCLVTYAQLLGYSAGSTFRHRQDILPAEATKTISPNP